MRVKAFLNGILGSTDFCKYIETAHSCQTVQSLLMRDYINNRQSLDGWLQVCCLIAG